MATQRWHKHQKPGEKSMSNSALNMNRRKNLVGENQILFWTGSPPVKVDNVSISASTMTFLFVVTGALIWAL
jgi:hypothetical protein